VERAVASSSRHASLNWLGSFSRFTSLWHLAVSVENTLLGLVPSRTVTLNLKLPSNKYQS
jgi:hypothetical protein